MPRRIREPSLGALAAFAIACSGDSATRPGELTITTSALPSGTVDAPYQASLAATGGTSPYRWSTSFDPPGLTTSAEGLISGTPGYPAGAYQLKVSVSDAANEGVTADMTLEVGAASGLRITSLDLTTGDANQPYADTLEAAGGSPPYTFDWSSVVGGLTLATSGVLSGRPTGPTGPHGEAHQSRVTVRDLVGASAFAIVRIGIRPAPLVIVTDLPDGQVGEPYEVDLVAEGGTLDRNWSVVSGALPPALLIQTSTLWSTVKLSGMPTTAGMFTFALQVTTAAGTATREYTVVIAGSPLSIVTSTIPDAHVGTPYSVFLVRTAGIGPYGWDVVSGSPPPGVSLSTAGELNGTPTTAGGSSFEVRVRDALGQSATASLALHVEP